MQQSAAEPTAIGHWKREKKLGSGGFGVVSLWRNAQTQQQIAVKQCHQLNDTGDKTADDVRRRWNDEVCYMTEKVEHENIVRGIRVQPESFLEQLQRAQPSQMPVLVMEYCEGGDLRRQLNSVQNACGFRERETRAILRSLGAAIAHLHQLKITHRDIKPENIVVKTRPNGQRVYKLTDLGYAKVLDHQTLVASLVGTLEYVAPELCHTNRYTNSVDYWSMGVIAYEIATGVRPFVPHLAFVRWMSVVKAKRSVHIAIVEGEPDKFTYEEHLPEEHRLSDELAARLEMWLRLALEWNPKQRGHSFEAQETTVQPTIASKSSVPLANALPPKLQLRIFSQLNGLLEAPVMRVFCLRTWREHSTALTGDRLRMAGLVAWLAEQTATPAARMRIVLPVAHPWTGECSPDTKPMDLYWPDAEDDGADEAEHGPMLFVYAVDDCSAAGASLQRSASTTTLGQPPAQPPLAMPRGVRQVAQGGIGAVAGRAHAERRYAASVFHACRTEQQRYRHALGGWHSLALRLNHDVQLAQADVDRMLAGAYRLDGSLAVVRDTMRLQAADAAERLASGKATVDRSPADRAMRADFGQLSESVRVLVEACAKISLRYRSVLRRSREEIGRRVFDRRCGSADLGFGVDRAAKALEILRCRQTNQSSVEAQLRDLRQAAECCEKRREELLNETDWLELQLLPRLAFEFDEIKKALRMANDRVAQFQPDVQRINATLFESVREQSRSEQRPNGAVLNGYLPAIDGIGGEQTPSVEFHIGKEVSPMPVATKVTSTSTTTAANVVGAESGSKSVLLLMSDVKTSSLMSSNEEMLQQMQAMIRQLNEDMHMNDTKE